jgi:hypothetical protein
MIVRIVSAPFVLVKRNTNDEIGTVYLFPRFENLIFKCIQTSFLTVELVINHNLCEVVENPAF